MRVLVTGGAGFIGSHIVDHCLQAGHEVRILDNLEPRVHPHGRPPYVPREAEFIQGSVINRSDWEHALEDCDVVYHQAAYQDYMLDFSKFLMVNSVSTALLYEVLIERNWRPQKIIVASSQAVYGEGQYVCQAHGFFLGASRSREQLQRAQWEVACLTCGQVAEPQMLKEEHPNPVNQYAVSKLSGEQIALGLGRIHQIPSVALRYSITQGPRQSLFNQYSGILRIFTTRALSGRPLMVYEDGLQTRDFIHVSDVAEANIFVLRNDSANYCAFNVGSGRLTRILDYAATICRHLGEAVPIEIPQQYRLGDNRHSVSSTERLEKLGWRPRRALDDMIGDFVAWLETIGGVPTDIPDAYSAMQRAGVVQHANGSTS